MAYASTVEVSRSRNQFRVTITETDAAASSEASAIEIGVKKFRVLRQVCVLTAGAGATVDPVLGRVTNPSGVNVCVENDTAGATIDSAPTNGVPCFTDTGFLYHRSNVNAGTDNAITSEYLLAVGW